MATGEGSVDRKRAPYSDFASEQATVALMVEQTFVFADLAGFTALTEAHGDETAADLATDFSERVRVLVAGVGGGEQKLIGDAVMVRVGSAAAAIELGLGIIDRVCAAPGFPVVRIGMNTGSATRRDGDWFGSAVNVAARVSAAAAGHEVLLTESTRIAAGELADVDLVAAGSRSFKNVGAPVKLYRARRRGEGDHLPEVDPVCRMAVARERAAGSLAFDGSEYLFCSLACARSFAAEPERYARASG